MLGRGRSRREYRVYAEDEFLGAKDIGHEEAPNGAGFPAGRSEDAVLGEASVDGWPGGAAFAEPSQGGWSEGASPASGLRPRYTAPRRRLPGLGRRAAGVVGIAAVAMVLSAILVHALRPMVDGGDASRPVDALAAPADGMSATRGARHRDSVRVPARVDAGGPGVAASAVAVLAHAGRSRRPHPDLAVGARVSVGASTGSVAGAATLAAKAHASAASEDTLAPAWTSAGLGEDEAVASVGEVSAGAEEAVSASPEFGFEH